MRTILAITSLLVLAGCASSEPWTRQDTVLQSIVTATLVMDAVQTSQIQYHPEIYEAMPVAQAVLGRQPKTSETWRYFAMNAAFNYLVARALPQRWRPYWQGATIAVETKLIFHNCALGLGSICKEDHDHD